MDALLQQLKLRKPAQQPKNWPTDIWYTPRPLQGDPFNEAWIIEPLSTAVTKDPARAVIPLPPGPVAHVKITPITNPGHPAINQNGLFASKNLGPDSFILVYCGCMHGPDDLASRESNYDLMLDREINISIDADRVGNEARFINDYRGVRAVGPNAEFRDIWIDFGNGQAMKGIGVFVLSAGKGNGGKDPGRVKGIKKGDEILVSYGKGFWSHRAEVGADIELNADALAGKRR